MNKVTKGTLAAAAAGTLLLGGVGTYATWKDQETVDAGDVSTGVLDLELENAAWAQDGTAISIADFDMVPGDALTYTVDAIVTAEGDNLEGTFSVTDGLTAIADSQDVSQYVTVTLGEPDYAAITGTNVDNKLAVDGTTGVVSFDEADTYKIPLTVTVSLNADLQKAQDLVVDLGTVGVVLTQS
ncbi:alternate-type signal peptide domain-containing protein [Arthrobacter sp. 35/47]|uniref:alternate-type signal peptide domain-containing protein n=1 Tax=Arthrobacter sp. 35/47 TaxID=269454 RepID=UPI0004B2B953|nr:alternate-type signal peptide domain-containing protein [Arthrobacter sp. 35/47]